MDPLRIYLLAGLILHKGVWEFMKRGAPEVKAKSPIPLQLQLVKLLKIGILLVIIVQTLSPVFLPITSDPSTVQLTGLCLYTAGLALAIAGRVHLGNNWLDIETAAVKRNQVTVSRGVYRFVRHPIYVGDLILLLGLELALNSWAFVGVFVLAPVVLYKAVKEESMLRRTLPGYDNYCATTKRFIPFVA